MHSGGYTFFDIWILTLRPTFLLLAINMVSCFLWSDRFTLIYFEKMSTKFPTVKNHSLSVVLPSKNGVTWKKPTGSAHNSNNLLTCFLGTTTVLQDTAEVLHARSPLITHSTYQMRIQGSRYNKINKLYCLINHVLSKTCIKKEKTQKCKTLKITVTTNTVWG